MRLILTIVLALATILCAALTLQRWRLDYNENGVYFDVDTAVTYDTDAIIGYGLVTVILFLATVGIRLVGRKHAATNRM